MLNADIAIRAGVNLADIESLIKGKVTAPVSMRLGVPPSDVEDFIKGRGTASMTQCLGLHSIDATQELARSVGSAGAVGIVIGWILARR
jgi:hypothetical protein